MGEAEIRLSCVRVSPKSNVVQLIQWGCVRIN